MDKDLCAPGNKIPTDTKIFADRHWVVYVIAGAFLAFAVYLISELFWKFWTKNKSGVEEI